MTRAAIISDDLLYRYSLGRIWDQALPILIVCMLNPSDADALRDDPTILALIWFARLWGYGGIRVINLRAYRASKPAVMFAAERAGVDTRGPDNVLHWRSAIRYAQNSSVPILVAWGNNALGADYQPFVDAAGEAGVELVCLGFTGTKGEPIHPAARGKHRVPRNRRPIIWQAAA